MGRGSRAVVLLSGGLDSATALALAIERGFEAFALTVHYGQRQVLEVERARRLAAGLGAAEHRVARVDLGGPLGSALTDPTIAVPLDRDEAAIGEGVPPTYVPARNTLFLSLALGWAELLEAHDVFIGVNAVDYSGYPDCRPAFLEAFEGLARVATRRGIEGEPFAIHAPLLRWSKGRIVGEAVRLGVDLRETLSCYCPDAAGRPCRRCAACTLRARGFREAGIEDPALA